MFSTNICRKSWEWEWGKVSCSDTKSLIESMQNPEATKTYIALCDSDGSWNGMNYLEKGWFTFNKPVKDKHGKLTEYTWTDICFVASTTLPPIANDDDVSTTNDIDNLEDWKNSIVLARLHTGRWHQIQQHLASGTIIHTKLGDSSHGRSWTNRIWKKNRHLMTDHTCLHLSWVQLQVTEYSPELIEVSCPLFPNLVKMLNVIPPGLFDEARAILAKEGINI